MGPGDRGTGTRTLPGAFTIDSDTLGFDTGDRVVLTGNSLPPGVAANTSYYVIRQSDGNDYILQQLNVHRSPVIQLATTLANAQAGIPIAITGNGSGTVWMLDRFWLLGTDTASLATGDFVQIYRADGNSLPAPLVNGGSYYWIDRGTNRSITRQPQLIAAGSGMLAYSEAAARANQPVVLTSAGIGNYLVYKQYQKRFTCNGVVDTAGKPSDIMTSLLSSCGGSLIRAGNRWRLQTAVWRGVSQTLVTEKHARGPIKVTTLVSRRDLFNGVRGTYISPGNFDQPADFPPYPDPARPDLDIFLAEDGGERIWSNDIQLPFTNTPSMAQRLAKIMLMQIRKQITIVFPANLAAIGITVGDVVQLSSIRMGWSNKTFECVDWTFVLDGGSGAAPIPGIDLTLRETDPACFDWQNGAETTGWWAPRTNLPSVYNIPTPALVYAVEERYVTAPGAGTASRAHIGWNPVQDGFTGYYQVAQWDAATAAIGYENPQTAATGTEMTIGPLSPGSTFCFAVRAINIFGIGSAWSAPLRVVIKGNTLPPPDLVNFRVEALANHAHITWAQTTDMDVFNGAISNCAGIPRRSARLGPTATGLRLLLAGTATGRQSHQGRRPTWGSKSTIPGRLGQCRQWIRKSSTSPGGCRRSSRPKVRSLRGEDKPHRQQRKFQLAIVPGDSSNMTAGRMSIPFPIGTAPEASTRRRIAFSVITDLGAVYGFRIDLDMNAAQIGASAFGDLATSRIKSQIQTTYDPP